MKGKVERRRSPDDREVCKAYFAGDATLEDTIKAIEDSERGDIRRRELEKEFKRLSAHFERISN